MNKNRGLNTAAKLIGYDGSTLSRIFRGVYEGSIAEVVDSIEKFKLLQEERATVNRPPYQETELYRTVEECANAARTYQKFGFIYGESQIGKTESLLHYASRDQYNHGLTKIVEMPVGGSLSSFIPALCDACRVSGKFRTGEAFGAIAGKLDSRMLLVVDECARAVPGTRADKTLDFIRALYDAKRFGVLLVGTNIFRDQMAKDKFEPFLRQLNRRVLFRRQLSDMPSRKDLNMFAAYYRLGPAEDEAYRLQRQVVSMTGLGVWLTTLSAANRKAQKEGKRMTWEHVIKAHAYFKRLEEKTEPEN